MIIQVIIISIQDEAEKGAEPTSNEVGIDIGAEALASQTSQSSQTGVVVVVNQQHQTSSSSSVGGGVTGGGGQTGLLNSQASQTSIGAGVVLSVDMETSQNNIDMEVGTQYMMYITLWGSKWDCLILLLDVPNDYFNPCVPYSHDVVYYVILQLILLDTPPNHHPMFQ